MKIAIDVSQAIYGTGVSSYTRFLTKNLQNIDKENEYILYGGSLRRSSELKKYANKVFLYPPSLADLVWNKLHKFPIENLLGDVDILHTSDWVEPPTKKAIKVTTVHDLYPLKFPRLIDKKVLEVHKRKLYWVFKESKLIIVPSLSTRSDLIDLGIEESRIRIIPEAATVIKADENLVKNAKSKYNLNGDYIIAIGATKLKNTERIVRAFHLARTGKDIKLVIVGRPVGVNLPEERNVRILGHVDNGDMAALLTGSSALVYPSIYEGFGIPILDAFNCDVPVVTSNNASIPEVAGDAAIIVDAESENSIAEGIVKAVRGPMGWISKGTEQLKKFSWEKTAQMTLDVYNEAAE